MTGRVARTAELRPEVGSAEGRSDHQLPHVADAPQGRPRAGSRANKRLWAPLSVAFLAFASSVSGLFNGFTYDDRYIVERNPAMHDLAHWWRVFAQSYWPKEFGSDGYRPLTITAFQIAHVLGGGSPLPFHAANILLYCVASVLVFSMARRILPFQAAWLAAALFAVHPVHVEAVANVVGQSELLVGVFLFGATALYLRDRQNGPLRASTAGWILLLYACACLSKEHGIVLPAILVAAELTVLGTDAELRGRLRDASLRIFFLAQVLVAVVFLGVRGRVLANMNNVGGFAPFTPFTTLKITAVQRILTAVGVVPEWIRLFLFPAHLASEYGPPAIPIAQGVEIWQLPGFLLLVATLAIAVVLRRRQPVIAFGIAFLCVTLLPSSNFLLPAGIVLAERTLFSPSAGAMLAVAGVVAALVRWRASSSLRPSMAMLTVVTLVLAAGIARSATRSRVWKDNDTLFRHAVQDIPDSYRAHFVRGAWLFEKHDMEQGEAEYHKSLQLFPYDPAVSYTLASQYHFYGLCEPALPLYKWTRELYPDFAFGRFPYAECLLETGHYAEAKQMAYVSYRAGANYPLVRRLVTTADSLARLKGQDSGRAQPH